MENGRRTMGHLANIEYIKSFCVRKAAMEIRMIFWQIITQLLRYYAVYVNCRCLDDIVTLSTALNERQGTDRLSKESIISTVRNLPLFC